MSREIEAWRASMFKEDAGRLSALAQNYLGGLKPSLDKHEIVRRLTVFLQQPETAAAMRARLDRIDILILGSIVLAGPLPNAALKGLFVGELPLADFNARLANLSDRLLIFKQESASQELLALTPFLVDALLPVISDAGLLFGMPDAARAAVQAEEPTSLRMTALALYAFLVDHPKALCRDGTLSSKACASFQRLCPAVQPEELQAVSKAFAAYSRIEPNQYYGSRAAGAETSLETMEACLAHSWNDLAWELVVARTRGRLSASTGLAAAFAPFFEREFLFSKCGLTRFLRMLSWCNGSDEDDPALVDAMLELSLLSREGEGFRCRKAALADLGIRQVPAPKSAAAEPAAERARLVVEGSGLVHLMPEASLSDRFFLISIAEARRLSSAEPWEFEISARSARRAFSKGMHVDSMLDRLASLSKGALPQALTFSIESWHEEYSRLRVFRGSFFAADTSTAQLLEASGVAAMLDAEKIGPGIYFVGRASQESIAEALASIGIEAPPVAHTAAKLRPAAMLASPADAAPDAADAAPVSGHSRSSGISHSRSHRGAAASFALRFEKGGGAAAQSAGAAAQSAGARLSDSGAADCTQRLRSVLAGFTLSAQACADLAERIDRGLIFDTAQLERLAGLAAAEELRAAERPVSPVDPAAGMTAGAMDYQGKLRIIRQAMKHGADRLDVQWTTREGERKKAFLRPVKIEQNSKGHLMEAENLGTGSPERINIGAMSSVKLLRAFYFGETT